MRKIIIMALSVFFIYGCAGAGQTAPEESKFQRHATITQDFDTTWDSVVEWFAINNTPLDKVDKEDGLITSERHLRSKDELDCGKATGQISWASAKMENVGGNINVIVRSKGTNKTKVIVTVFGRGEINIRNGLGNSISSAEAKCVSTGALEKSLFTYLESI